MTHKKLITLILCFVLCFTFVSAPFRAEAAAIAIPATVLGIVGLFVVSAGFTFDTVGDFRTAVTDFCNKNFNMSNGLAFMSVLTSIPTTLGGLELASALQSEFFPEFWQAIKEFFGGGEVEVETGTPAPPDGMAYYNGYLFSAPPANYSSSYIYHCIIKNGDTFYYLQTKSPLIHTSTDFRPSSTTEGRKYSITDNVISSTSTKVSSVGIMLLSSFDVLWSNSDILEYQSTDVYMSGSEAVTSGDLVIENIPVTVESTYNPAAVYNGWMSKVEAEPWMTYDASSAVFQDITTAETDKTAPMTATQAGVISQGGVKVETETDVVIPEYTGEYAVNGLTSIFPFCIPFDIYDFFSVLVAEREAPMFDFNLNFGKLGQYPLSVDLSGWDTAATILRTIELLAFCVGLALATSKLIKW